MVPENFNWQQYSENNGLDNRRYTVIRKICLDYWNRKAEYDFLMSGAYSTRNDVYSRRRYTYSSVEWAVERADQVIFLNKLIDEAVRETDYKYKDYILGYITNNNVTYELLSSRGLDCDKEYFYKCWRYCICLINEKLKDLTK